MVLPAATATALGGAVTAWFVFLKQPSIAVEAKRRLRLLKPD